jgi:hypothetical protein
MAKEFELDSKWFILIFLAIVAVIYGMFCMKESFAEVEYVTSLIDGRSYLVKNMPDSQKAADMLAKLNIRFDKLIDAMQHAYPDNRDVDRLIRNYVPENLSEGNDDTNYTSYSVNKGEKIVFCLRSRDGKNSLEDMNTLMYVGTHELAHLMTKEVGHTPTFWANFKLLLEKAVDVDLYKKVDYSSKPKEYCGIKITSTVLKE